MIPQGSPWYTLESTVLTMKTALLTFLALVVLPQGGRVEPPTVGFDVLGSFDYEEGMELPKEVTQHHKKRVQVAGFMTTEDGSEGEVAYFIIVNEGSTATTGRSKGSYEPAPAPTFTNVSASPKA